MTTGTLTERIQGSPQIRILREFATNSGIFPIFNAIRFIAESGLTAYLLEPTNYIILLASAVQAWFLGRRAELPGWQRAAGNLIAPALYTAADMIVEGPTAFFTTPYHWIFWGFSVGMALLYGVESLAPRSQGLAIILQNLWRVMLFPALYFASELGGELSSALSLDAFRTYWKSSSGHFFIVMAAVLFGLLLGLSEAQVSRYTAFLKRVARRLKEFSEWSLDADLLEESIEDVSVLGQRRAERVILFMDIRGFTGWSEDKDPETVVRMLNGFYEMAESILVRGGGHKPHFIGDEVMTWFDEPTQAVEATRVLKREANALLARYGLASGGGLHLGEVVEGLVGSSSTRSYNILGDAVNTTSRLCDAAGPGEVLISENLARRLALIPELGQPRTIQAKGKQEPIQVYPL